MNNKPSNARIRLALVLTVCLIYFQGPFGGLAVMTILPVLKKSFLIGIDLIALAVTLYGLILGSMQLIAGMLSDRFGRKKIITIGLVFYIIGTAITSTVTTFWEYLLTRAIQGFGDGMINSVTVALAGDIVSEKDRGKVMGALSTSLSLALALGPLFGGVVASFNWRWIFVTMSCFGIINLFLLTTIFRGVKEAYIQRNTGSILSQLKIAFRNKIIVILALLSLIMGFGRLALFTYLPDTLSQPEYAFSSVEIGYAMFLASLGGIFASPLTGYLLDALGRLKTVMIGFLAFITSLFTFAFLDLLSYWIYLTFYFGFSIAIFQTALQTITADVSDETRGTNLSLVLAVMFTGSSTAPLILVPIYQVYGLVGVTTFCGFLVLLGFFAFLPFRKNIR